MTGPDLLLTAFQSGGVGRVELAIRMYERITGKKLTPEAIVRLRKKAGLE